MMTRTHVLRSVAFALTLVGCSAGSPSADPSSAACGSGGAAPGSTTSTLPQLDLDLSQTSTSGLSSGGFMAVQFHVAFSSIMKGVAVFAGGPFGCANGALVTALTQCMTPYAPIDPSTFVKMTNTLAAAGAIDDVANLAHQQIFLFGGANDSTVAPAVMDSLDGYYKALVTSGTVTYESRHAGTAHTMPTVGYGGTCAVTGDPWIGKCDYDGAGKALSQIYGTLAPAATTLSGTFTTIAQSAFITSPASHSLDESAFAYVPKSCADGAKCRVHVVFHGCKQEASGDVGDKFYKNAGYNEWADTNQIVVLYPQTIVSTANPNACWDWWGYDSPDYTKKTGPQMAMVRAMIDGLAAGTK